jgi:hypothetical protein
VLIHIRRSTTNIQRIYRNRKRTIDKEKYRFPKSLVRQIDTISDTIYFNITREQAQQFKRK